MTVSDQQVRPPDNPPPGPEWKPIPGAPGYEASHRGKVRSIDRERDGRQLTGKEMSQRLQNRTRDSDTVYKLTDVRRANRSKWTATVQSFVLLAHVGPPPPGMEICHGGGGPFDNRWPENIWYDTKLANEGMKDRPVQEPKPPTPCINHARCGGYVTTGGKRCHPCVVLIGDGAALLLADQEKPSLKRTAELLGYPSAEGVFKLAVEYGGLRCYIPGDGITDGEPAAVTQRDRPPFAQRLRSVIVRARASRRNSDAQ